MDKQAVADKSDPKDSRPVPARNQALAIRSSSLVKRGLQSLRLQQARTVSLPSDVRWQEFGLAILNGLDPPFPIDIQFEELPEYSELARVVESTVWLNRSHPTYQRALASRAIGYHIALAVAMALAPFVVEPVNEREFVKSFMSWWGKKAKPEGE
jgi:hypothetical protein